MLHSVQQMKLKLKTTLVFWWEEEERVGDVDAAVQHVCYCSYRF